MAVRMTKQERKSAGIAKRLAKAIADIEEYDGDPSDIISDARISATHYNSEVLRIIEHLGQYYEEVSK